MESSIDRSRLGRAADIAEHIELSFFTMAPTIRFPYPVIAHDDLGLCALIVREDVMLYDGATGHWYAAGQSFDALMSVEEAAYDLAAAIGAPSDRVTCVAWLPSGISADQLPPGSPVIVTVDPKAAAAAIEDHMRRALSGSAEPTSPWLGSYISSAMVQRETLPDNFSRFLKALEFSLRKELGNTAIVAYGIELGVNDIADPRFLLPALIISAAEDWNLASNARPRGTGFEVNMTPDPTALLGYRITDIQPAIPYTALTPAVATAARTFDGDDYRFDDLIRQFGRWLEKLNLDAMILEDIELRLATSA